MTAELSQSELSKEALELRQAREDRRALREGRAPKILTGETVESASVVASAAVEASVGSQELEVGAEDPDNTAQTVNTTHSNFETRTDIPAPVEQHPAVDSSTVNSSLTDRQPAEPTSTRDFSKNTVLVDRRTGLPPANIPPFDQVVHDAERAHQSTSVSEEVTESDTPPVIVAPMDASQLLDNFNEVYPQKF